MQKVINATMKETLKAMVTSYTEEEWYAQMIEADWTEGEAEEFIRKIWNGDPETIGKQISSFHEELFY